MSSKADNIGLLHLCIIIIIIIFLLVQGLKQSWVNTSCSQTEIQETI